MNDDYAGVVARMFVDQMRAGGPVAGLAHGRMHTLAADLLDQNAALIAQIAEMEKKMMQMQVSAEFTPALWCEQGGHAFSGRDPRKQLVIVRGADSDGNPVEEARTACGQCAVPISAPRHNAAPSFTPVAPSVMGAHEGGTHEQRPAF